MTPKSAATGIGCLVLFLLPFAGIGAFAAVQVVRFAAAGAVNPAAAPARRG